jgi:hypothetical protein
VKTSASPTTKYNPLTVSSPRGERALLRSGINPIGSRRRRAALKSADNLPFEQLPYQCFQEARKVLQADREEKLQAIKQERARISLLTAQDASTIQGGERQKQIRLDCMSRRLEKLKILADINDPLIKKRFEDGEGMDTYFLIRISLVTVLINIRGYEQAHLSLPGRQEMALIPTTHNRATPYANEHRARCPLAFRAYS